jgi:hypothetical protein
VLFLSAALATLCATASARQQTLEVEVQVPCVEGEEPFVVCYRQWAECALDTAVDVDTFTFFGRAGDPVHLALRSSGGVDPRVHLFAPDGGEVGNFGCQGPCSIAEPFTLHATGWYTLTVNDDGSDETGPFTLSLERVLPDVSVAAMDLPGTAIVTFEFPGDHDFIAFQGHPMFPLEIGVNSTLLSKNLEVQGEIYYPTGLIFMSDAPACAGPCFYHAGHVSPHVAGTYLYHFWDAGHDDVGSFVLNLDCPSFVCPDPRVDVPLGQSYCTANPNSSGLPATITAHGSRKVADNYLELVVTDAPPGKLGLFLASPTKAFAPMGLGGQGFLCVGSPVLRFPLLGTCAPGTARYMPDLTNLPQAQVFLPGSVWNFQLWFRDDDPGPTSNSSDGLEIQF